MINEFKKIIEIIAITSNWETIRKQICDWLKELNLNSQVAIKILIVCEELFVNISKHAYEMHEKPGSVKIIFNYNAQRLKICFIDSGKPFNPLDFLNSPIDFYDEKNFSGGGVLLIKNFTDAQDYKFENNKNIFTVTKFI
jgi:sigma-B regulation protein RsbU (phosphoserine phosphatase)